MEKDKIIVYHGTRNKYVNDILTKGLIDKTGYNQGWYMCSTDFESALYHAQPDEEGGDVPVIKFEIPNEENDRWTGYPYLWAGHVRNSNSTWYALMTKIPKDFITKVYRISNEDWLKQKQLGY